MVKIPNRKKVSFLIGCLHSDVNFDSKLGQAPMSFLRQAVYDLEVRNQMP